MSKPIPDCGVCFTRYISKVSNIWCSECGEGLCKEHHGSSKSNKHHVTVPIEEYRKLPVFILEMKEICEKHNEKYQMFCKSELASTLSGNKRFTMYYINTLSKAIIQPYLHMKVYF
jgi:hypothetical protein